MTARAICVFLTSLCVTSITHSQPDVENGDMKILMEVLSQKLHILMKKLNVLEPQQKRALVHTMSGIVGTVFAVASLESEMAAWNVSDASRQAAKIAANNSALNAAARATIDASRSLSTHADVRARAAARKSMEDAIAHAIQEATAEMVDGSSIYRTAEYIAWHHVIAHFEAIVESIYNSVSPANEALAMSSIYQDYIRQLSDDAMLFLTPWLTWVLPFNQLSQKHQALFERFCHKLQAWPTVSQLLKSEYESTFAQVFPKEVVRLFTLSLVAVHGHAGCLPVGAM